MTGHIDGVGRIIRWERAGQDHVLEIAAPPELMRYVVFKGSIAVDGISLTVATAAQKSFRIWIIPHTYEVTALRERAMGDAVNLEADLLEGGHPAKSFRNSVEFDARRGGCFQQAHVMRIAVLASVFWEACGEKVSLATSTPTIHRGCGSGLARALKSAKCFAT